MGGGSTPFLPMLIHRVNGGPSLTATMATRGKSLRSWESLEWIIRSRGCRGDSAASLLLTVLQRIWGDSWGLAGKLAEMERGLRQAITDSTKEVEEKQSRASHDVGETIAAIREKIREVELFNRDTFLRRDEFYKVTAQNSEALKSVGEKIEARLERMEAKIDAKT